MLLEPLHGLGGYVHGLREYVHTRGLLEPNHSLLLEPLHGLRGYVHGLCRLMHVRDYQALQTLRAACGFKPGLDKVRELLLDPAIDQSFEVGERSGEAALFGRHGRTVEPEPEALLYESTEGESVLRSVRRRSLEEGGIVGDIGLALLFGHDLVYVDRCI